MKYNVLLLGLGRIGSTLEKDPLRYHPCTHAGVLLNSSLSKNFVLMGIYYEKIEKINDFLSDWNFKNKKLTKIFGKNSPNTSKNCSKIIINRHNQNKFLSN